MRIVREAKHKAKKIKRAFENKNKIDIKQKDKNKVWAFCSGQYSNDFRGNPKFLFIYVNKYRPDIEAYWLCNNDDVIAEVKKMGYKAYKIGTVESEEVIDRTGVLVAEQVKAGIPKGLEDAKYLNLWHGVGGVKNVERSIKDGILLEEIGKKYIKRNEYYRSNELYLAPSKIIEDIAMAQLGLESDQIIKAGYPRCMYQKMYDKVSTFDSNLTKGLPEDTKIICYAPTYRNGSKDEIFTTAIPKLKKLIEVCEKKHLLMIFKMHPIIENETGFLRLKEKYKDCKWLLFWDNTKDFYEVMDQVDLCIYDYSSIFTDFIAVGTKNFIRYAFDFEDNDLSFVSNYDEVTVGKKCKTYDELLKAIESYDKQNIKKKREEIKNLYWEYATDDSLERIIDETLAYENKELKLPNLYSFDIFDTVFSRKCLDPKGIFYYVKHKILTSDVKFPLIIMNDYPQIREYVESNIREYYNRTRIERNDDRCEIQFDEIYNRIQELYNLSDEQIELLKEWELEAELENVYPLENQISKIKKLLDKGEKVVLVSDMYLPKDFIKKMLEKADPILGTLDLYLSSEYGYEKAKKYLYLEVYNSFGENYNFKRWIHTGDNIHSDRNMARKLNIETRTIDKVEFNDYEQALVDRIGTYDAYLVAAKMARYRVNHHNAKNIFTYSYISLLFVPYIRWAMHDAKKDGKENIYFVSRDGHQLKRIGDVVNKIDNLGLNTEYFYASRKTWRIPSFIDNIDIDFWGMGHGNFVDIKNYSKLLQAMNLSDEEFRTIFPELTDIDENTEFNKAKLSGLAKIFENSEEYKKVLLEKAAEQRKSVCAYLEQTLDKKKEFAIIEYWGRGYTQENFTRLWHHILKKEVPVTFYYSRSTLPTDGYNVRKNFTANPIAQQYIESIFACIPYKSIEGYELEGKKWKPIIKPNDCDMVLFKAMEKLLPKFTKEYCELEFQDSDAIGRALINFAMDFYDTNPQWEGFTEVLAKLTDSVQLYGEVEEFAPPITKAHIKALKKGDIKYTDITKNITLSLYRTMDEEVKEEFYHLYQISQENDAVKGILSKKNRKLAEKLRKKNERANKKSLELYELYKEAASKTEVTNKIIVLTYGLKDKDLEIESLINVLKDQKDFEYKIINTFKTSKRRIAEELSNAKYVIMKKPLQILANMDFRKETKVVVLSETVMNYFQKGVNKKSAIKAEEDLEGLTYNISPNILQMPTYELMDMYRSNYNLKDELEVLDKGSVVTDMYYDEKIKKDLLKKLYKKFPAAKKKKIICYAPYERIRNKKSSYYEFLNMKLLQEKIGKDYVVIINFRKNNYYNKMEIKGFSKILTEDFSIREMMIMADVIIADYRDTTFESPLLNVPVFMSTWDSNDVDSRINNLFSVSENRFGVPIKDTDDFINKIRKIESHDFTYQNEFKERFLKTCDGNSAKELFKFLKEQAEIGDENEKDEE